MSAINFEAKIVKVGDLIILRIPKSVSQQLPSRGMVMVEGIINNLKFQRELEPDGKGSHFLELNQAMLKATKTQNGDTVRLSIEPSRKWPEPRVPEDLKKALAANTAAYKTWEEITPMARWDWIRWIRSTKNPQTRAIRIEKTFSKFKSGIRRPCCFNRSACSIPDISRNGVLLETT